MKKHLELNLKQIFDADSQAVRTLTVATILYDLDLSWVVSMFDNCCMFVDFNMMMILNKLGGISSF